MMVLMICGSRNHEGQTARAADAVLGGAIAAGASVERVFLPELELKRCRQCGDTGWGPCRSEGRCVITDDFASLVAKLKAADAVLFATPVYYSDLSESMRACTDRLRRTCMHEAGRSGVAGTPAVGLCVAGGGGGGAPGCCSILEKVLARTGLDVVDVIPVRRQNLDAKLPRLRLAGEWLATAPAAR